MVLGRADGSAWWKFREGGEMGSATAARGKSAELKRSAEQMGEILCKLAFGERGPDLSTSLVDLEQVLGPVLEQMAAGFLRTSVTQQSMRLTDELPCPTCGGGCSASEESRERTTATEHGDFCWSEPAFFCDRCQRSFFPAAERAED
jgi:hypothetical protein